MQKKPAIKICLIIILACIFVGAPLKESFSAVILATYIITIIYLILGKTKRIPFSFIDAIVMAFCLSPIIPLLFQTSINKNDTIFSIYQGIGLLCIWLITRISVKEEKDKNIIKITTICCIVFLGVLGLDELTTRMVNTIF